MSGALFHQGFSVQAAGRAPVPDNVRLEHNTFYSADVNAGLGDIFTPITLASGVTNVTVRNNLGYAPNAASPVMVLNNGAVSPTISNNSLPGAISTNPNFASATPANPVHFKLIAPSYAIGTGISVPVWSDFFLVPEPSPRDIGAVNH